MEVLREGVSAFVESRPYTLASFRKSIVLLCCLPGKRKAKTQNQKRPLVRRKASLYIGGFFRPVPATNELASLCSLEDQEMRVRGGRWQ